MPRSCPGERGGERQGAVGIGPIHDMLVFKLSCKLTICYAGGQTLEKKANCGKSACRNIEITLLKSTF